MDYKKSARKIIKRLEEQGGVIGNKKAVYKVCKMIKEEKGNDNLEDFVNAFRNLTELHLAIPQFLLCSLALSYVNN